MVSLLIFLHLGSQGLPKSSFSSVTVIALCHKDRRKCCLNYTWPWFVGFLAGNSWCWSTCSSSSKPLANSIFFAKTQNPPQTTREKKKNTN